MLPTIELPERSFPNLESTREFIAVQDRRDYELPIRNVTVSEDGTLRADRFEGRIASSGLNGILNTLHIPEVYATKVCPPDLLVHSVHRLARDRRTAIRIQSVNGVATAFMPSDRQPIRQEILLDWLADVSEVREVILGPNYLRITSVSRESRDVLPGDPFGHGWELINDENGWGEAQIWRYAMRLVCTNGMWGFDRTASFSRDAASREPILKSLERLSAVIKESALPPELEKAIAWAAANSLQSNAQEVMGYLLHALEGEATRLALKDVISTSTWYDLLNSVTATARLRPVEMRRRYELAGGRLLNWFMREGRGRPPWQRVRCENCALEYRGAA